MLFSRNTWELNFRAWVWEPEPGGLVYDIPLNISTSQEAIFFWVWWQDVIYGQEVAEKPRDGDTKEHLQHRNTVLSCTVFNNPANYQK